MPILLHLQRNDPGAPIPPTSRTLLPSPDTPPLDPHPGRCPATHLHLLPRPLEWCSDGCLPWAGLPHLGERDHLGHRRLCWLLLGRVQGLAGWLRHGVLGRWVGCRTVLHQDRSVAVAVCVCDHVGRVCSNGSFSCAPSLRTSRGG